jgi:HNH endonuclease
MEIKSQDTIKIIGKTGRPANDIVYINVTYHGKDYTIMKIKRNDNYIKTVIDTEDIPKIKDYSWHYIATGYIGHTIQIDDKRKELYLHNMIMGRLIFPGKGTKESVDHINRNGLDNRKENLRIVTQSAQNINQKQKERHIELPANSGVTIDEIPKHIWYIKANGSHGERFGIDLKTENVKWKSTSAKNVSLQDKLKAAKEQLQIYYQQFPYLNPNHEDKNKEMEELSKSYEEIVALVE